MNVLATLKCSTQHVASPGGRRLSVTPWIRCYTLHLSPLQYFPFQAILLECTVRIELQDGVFAIIPSIC